MNKNISLTQPPAWAAGTIAAAAIALSVSLPMGSTAFASESQTNASDESENASSPLIATGEAPVHALHAADTAATDSTEATANDAGASTATEAAAGNAAATNAPAAAESTSDESAAASADDTGAENTATAADAETAPDSIASTSTSIDSSSTDNTACAPASTDSTASASASANSTAETTDDAAEATAPATFPSPEAAAPPATASTSETTVSTSEFAVADAAATTGDAADSAFATSLMALDATSFAESADDTTPIEEGSYTIQSALDRGMVVDIAGGSHDDEGNVNLYESNGTLAQSFQFVSAGGGYYRIINVGSGKAVDVRWGSSDDEANVWQYGENGTDAQLWLIVANDDGSFTFINKGSGKALDVQWGDAVDGTNIWQYAPNGSAAQRFFLSHSVGFVSVEDGTYVIQSNLNSQNVLDVAGAELADETNVQAYTDNGTNAQRFDVQQTDDGWYTITSVQSGKALDVEWASTDDGANVWQYASNGTDAQKWRFLQNDDGSLSLMNKASRLVLDLANGDSDAGTNVQQYGYNSTAAQRFTLVSASYVPPIANGTYVITSALDSSFALDVTSASSDDLANVQAYTRNGTDAQSFTVTYDGDGWYTITNVGSGKCLDVHGAHVAPGTNVDQYASNGTDAQKWRIVAQGNYFALISKCSGMVLEISGAAANGANVQVNTSTDALNQRFAFDTAPQKPAITPADRITLDGYDISSWQPYIDVAAVPGQFVIVKATEDTDYTNPYLRKASEALNAGKKIGLYHFASIGNAVEQARYYVRTVSNYVGRAVLALDWEAQAMSQGVSWAKTWLDTVYSLTGVRPLIYMSKSVTTEYDWSSVAATYQLWVAQYPNYDRTDYQDTPWRSDDDYGAWTSGPTLFQYASSGRLNGYDGTLDLDKFYGTTADWDRLASQA